MLGQVHDAAPLTSVKRMEQPAVVPGVTIVRLRHAPPAATVALFCASFPRHPISRLDRATATAFLGSYARIDALYVALREDGLDVGFLVGGDTAALDRTRSAFIRRHALAIAAASARSTSLTRLLVPRLRPKKSFAAAPCPARQLRFIAVDPRARGTGVGMQLVSAFEATLDGAEGYHTWTMAGALGAEGFFTSLGFTRDMALGDHLRLHKMLAR